MAAALQALKPLVEVVGATDSGNCAFLDGVERAMSMCDAVVVRVHVTVAAQRGAAATGGSA